MVVPGEEEVGVGAREFCHGSIRTAEQTYLQNAWRKVEWVVRDGDAYRGRGCRSAPRDEIRAASRAA